MKKLRKRYRQRLRKNTIPLLPSCFKFSEIPLEDEYGRPKQRQKSLHQCAIKLPWFLYVL